MALNVLHALGLVINRQVAAGFEHRSRGGKLHRVVMLDRDVILAAVTHRRGGAGRLRVAAAWRWRKRVIGLRQGDESNMLAAHVRQMRRRLVFDADERSGEAGDLRLFGDHQRGRLAAEQDAVVVERPVGEPSGARSSL